MTSSQQEHFSLVDLPKRAPLLVFRQKSGTGGQGKAR